MGTNFYYFKDKITEQMDPCSGLHIGKCSGGWVFNFEAHPQENLMSVKQYRKFLKEGVIYDEYGDLISYKNFWKKVESTLKSEFGYKPHTFDDDGVQLHFQAAVEWLDEGFVFTLGDFS